MIEGAALDTDILLKISAYRLAHELIVALQPYGRPATLGLTHLIAEKQLKRKRGIRDHRGAAAELTSLLAQLEPLEPDEKEIALAADLAARAQDLSLPLDTGEAQLAAVTAMRGLPMLITGDKRALVALSSMLLAERERAPYVGRLVCFEQVLAAIATKLDEHSMRNRICAEPDVDGAMRIACSCGRSDWDPSQLHTACSSFVRAVAAEAGDLIRTRSLLA